MYVIIILLAVGTFGSQNLEAQQRSDINSQLELAMVFEPGNLDPAQDYNGWFVVQSGLGETLFRLDREMEIESWLAESAERKDEYSWQSSIYTG